jgi:peroxin-2
MDLMNLRYRDERRAKILGRGGFKTGMEGPNLSVTQRLLYGVIFVGGRYAWSKFTRRANTSQWADEDEHTWRHRAWRSIGFAENAHSAASLMNLTLFLRHGRYRSLLERLLRARLVYKEPNMSRVISFEYLNRQLVWQELSVRLAAISNLVHE